ncbi:pyridoxal phosphate-dependent aminotransferase [Pelobacter propionicus]|uniref:Aminotransferase n=1 Tax=Pelobacter propionicus (strain DSM 2379 / NBRC 103807 / OttBd1) TaxID=338966 RepID=A1AR27_PELPD|nr:pyridoxal phosphate-dependent aminotransferase [Pelobacter propionicus]ABK99797.1 L-aspartate aminotransferase apoenzyme [Pelobacter propionicus DSM 2379]
MKLADRVHRIQPSPTLAIDAKAKALKAQGVDVISFGAGEPDFDTPDAIRDAARNAIDSGFTRYMPVGGADDLKDAIILKMKRDHGIEYSRAEICVSCGAKHSLYNISQALIQEGDEVIIPAPYWVSYPDQVVLAGGTPIFIQTDEKSDFKITPRQLEAAITPRTKAMILNSPCNPTGTSYTGEELRAIAQVCLAHDFIIISDDIYERLIYDGQVFSNIVQVAPELKQRVVLVNGVSKTYAMTGWRIGYACGPQELIAAMTKMQSQSTSNACSIAQKASVEAIAGSQEKVTAMVQEFEKRRTYIVQRLNAMPGVTCFNSTGAFYAFPNFSALYGKSFNGKIIASSTDLADYLLEEAKVALVPGVAFGDDRYARLSYAIGLESIAEGMDRLERAIQNLK